MKPQVISFKCILKNSAGRLISTTFNRDVFSINPEGERVDLPELAKKLGTVKKGERRSIHLDAAEAFGLYNPDLVLQMPRSKLPRGHRLKLGDHMQVQSNAVMRQYRVTEVNGELLTLDANHPLAGQDLVFDIDVMDAREATESELQDSPSFAPPHILH